MAKTYWKTSGQTSQRRSLTRPSPGQILAQLVIAGLIVVIWGALFWGFLRVTGAQAVANPSPQPTGAAAVEPSPSATPSPSPSPAPVDPTPSPTSEPSPTPEASPTTAGAPQPTEPPPPDTPTIEPTPTATATPEPLPPTETPAPASGQDTGVSFAADVLPILERRCVKCHGGLTDEGELRIEEGLRLTSHADVLAGSWNGPVVEPGDVEDSFLIEQIVTGEMPKREPRLLPAEIRAIQAWVEAGAPDN